ncbi:CGNR zinc finger domain-containing protein [Nonomuraea jiangxiensis]|uniref:CGNR zinc finger domain-containing protein n=1 Tax=Nonomuraea jiangxiensis TaxID=633440 RepID=UPI00115FB1F0|nr:CGNR zinc finger domain-containing protein [Nonomuraea jiangxiensis]
MLAVPALDVSRVVVFVNEYAVRPRAAAGEQEMPYPDAADVLVWPGRLPIPAVGDLVAAANAAFRVFSSAHDSRAFEELNGLLRSARPSPVATESGLCWMVDAPGEVLPAALGTCLLEWLMNHEQARLGTCHASKCVDVYTDASPAGQRRFCSSTCLNRHKVAAYRQRSSRSRGRTGKPETS